MRLCGQIGWRPAWNMRAGLCLIRKRKMRSKDELILEINKDEILQQITAFSQAVKV